MPIMKTIVILTYDLLSSRSYLECITCLSSDVNDRIEWKRRLIKRAIKEGFISPDFRIEIVDSFRQFTL